MGQTVIALNPEEQRRLWRESSAAYRNRHPERSKQSQQRYKQTHVEVLKQRGYDAYWANPEKRREQIRKSHQKHRQKRRDYQKQYSARNREKLTRNQRAWAAKNPEKMKASRAKHGSKRKALTRGAMVERKVFPICQKIRLSRKVRCYYCGRDISNSERHIEHIIPLIKGGKHSSDNVCAACPKCNLTKKAKQLGEWQPPTPQPLLRL